MTESWAPWAPFMIWAPFWAPFWAPVLYVKMENNKNDERLWNFQETIGGIAAKIILRRKTDDPPLVRMLREIKNPFPLKIPNR